ncbi:alpha-hydroxy acid oxidase [Nocardioides euryhalodurans]|uniref:Alpha-hydroxy-acid oxidizing enzyme n=1 Tax=Nocardioides euryhalodurans TaxID=2518370 RepID=A0A4P7GI24_9ACTN|nr:alpha-hydroxy acid oxidase [Nocardioides euryhalodurans]QBR91588.1 alpha-hydroxy-acid oxidizing enzyme [Nocardioides euryhalodurans]
MTWQADLAERARAAMPEPMWDYTRTGALEGVTAAEAEAAWADVRFAPRVLRDVTDVEVSTSLLGADLATPVGVAPTAMQRVAHPDGERAMARGAAAAGALHVVSSNAGYPFAAIDVGSPWWVQAYLPPRRAELVPMLEAAVRAGARAAVLTVDTPVPGDKRVPREEDWRGIDLSWFRCNVDAPAGVRWAADVTPDDIGWLREATGLPVVVKGVLRADDARTCVEAGAAAVWVSNHGGRQLDRAVSTRYALPHVAAEVGDDVEVYVDGGIRSGLDVLAGLALGADAVFCGRLPVHALAAGGAPEVAGLLTRLTQELVDAMRLAGCPRPSDTRGIVAQSPPQGL